MEDVIKEVPDKFFKQEAGQAVRPGHVSALEIPQSIQRTAYPSLFCKYY
jgi:hypothetical protein